MKKTLLRVCSPLTLSDTTIRLRTILAEKQTEEEANERSREQFRDLGRGRLEHLKRDTLVWIPERSGRAVTPDCSRISRGSYEKHTTRTCSGPRRLIFSCR
jgi:hypothetical protein